MKKLFGSIVLATLLSVSLGTAQTTGRPAPDFIVNGQWFNSKPLSIHDLRGKVVIVNLWVYSCINCHRSLPTLATWYKKYKDQGLEIVGPHSPEFESDKIASNVATSLKEDNVTWPVFQDNKLETWNAYDNRFWPSFYLIDKQGMIREVHEGELSSVFPNGIAPFEAEITKLLAEPAQ